MLRLHFFGKLFAGMSALILITTIGIGGLVYRQVEENLTTEMERELEARLTLLEPLVEGRFGEPVQARAPLDLSEPAAQLGMRITLIRGDGVVLVDTAEDPTTMNNHGWRPEVLAARRGEARVVTRYSHTLEEPMVYVARALPRKGELRGFLRVAMSGRQLAERRAAIRRALLTGAAIATIAGVLLSFFFTMRIARPLRTLTSVVEAFAKGDETIRVHSDAVDEVGVLARAFNRLADNLEERVESLQQEGNKLAAILGAMAEGVIAVDREQRILHMNDEAGRTLAIDPEAAIGQRIWEAIRQPALLEAVDSALADGRADAAELRLIQSRGDTLVELTVTPLRNALGELRGVVLVLDDVTRLRRLEAMRRDFVTNVSHELKTPLTAIRLFVETLLDDEAMPADTRQRFLGKVKAQTDRLQTLISDLLTLSRIESAEDAMRRTRLDLKRPIRETLARLSGVAEAKGLSLEVAVTEDPLPVLGDQEALEQLVGNLLDNAIKYTARGRVRLDVRRLGEEVVVAVEDTGPGIAKDHQERVFERFYRVDKARSRELGGTGLGLSIVKHIALSLGGRVGLESRPGQGSTFRVTLPLAAERETESGGDSRGPEADSGASDAR